MPFKCNGYNLVSEVFLTETDIIDRYVGNQLWLWGGCGGGSLGTNTIVSHSSPVQTVSRGNNWEFVSSGIATAAIKTDGTLWTWGLGAGGALGNNSIINRSSPVQTISSGTNWKQVSVGTAHSSAIKTDGTLWLWGCNVYGRLGDNSTINKSSPVQTVATGANWKQSSSSVVTTAAIKTDGTLWLWGGNACGTLGTNSTINQSSPVQTVAQGMDWKQVSMTCCNTAAIKNDGTLWLWGTNTLGQLGTNTTTSRSSPVQTIITGNNWKQVSLGYYNSSAIKIDGTLWIWGSSAGGNLGNNSTISQSIPVQTISSGTNWKQVSIGCNHVSGLKTDGTLWVWGCNNTGALGDNSTINKSSPVQTVALGTNWKQINAGGTRVAAVNHTDN